MKKHLTIIILLFPFLANAQIIAGQPPAGTHIVYTIDSISASNLGDKDSIEIDLDCDSVIDMKLILQKGAPQIDAPHTLKALFVDTSFQLCWIDSLPSGSPRTMWYDLNDTMDCNLGYRWKSSNPPWNDEILQVGGFGAYPPRRGTDTFFAVRKNTGLMSYEYGWISISFNFYTVIDPYVVLKSYVAFCAPNKTKDYNKLHLFELYPSLTNNDFILSSKENFFLIEILNQLGQSVFRKEFNNAGKHNISMRELPNGQYFVRFESKNGSQVIRIQKY